MRFSLNFTKSFLILLWYSLPVLGSIALIITLCGVLLADLENLPVSTGVYFAWVTGTTVGYGDLSPTSDAARTLAIIIALIGIPFDGLIVGAAIIAARLAVNKHSRLAKMVQTAESRLDG